jgi:hypothetical protein
MITWLFLAFLLVLVLVVGAFLIAAYVTLKRQIGSQTALVDGKVGDVRGEVRTFGMTAEAELERLKAVDMRQDSLHAATTSAFKGALRRVDARMAGLAEKDAVLDASIATMGRQILDVEARYAKVRSLIDDNMRQLAQLDGGVARNKEAIAKIAGFLYEAARQADELMAIIESVFTDFDRRIAAFEGDDLPRRLAELANLVAAVDENARAAMEKLIARLDARGEVAGALREHSALLSSIRDRLTAAETSEQAAAAEAVRARLAELEARSKAMDAMGARLAALEGDVARAQADTQKTINSLKVSKLQIGDKWSLSGVGDAHGNDEWLRLMDAGGKDYYGGLAAGKLWAGEGASVGASGVEVRGSGPGPLIQKVAAENGRYGVAHGAAGETHLYAPSSVHMSFATGKDAYDSVVIADKDKAGEKQVTVRGNMSVAKSVCVDGACFAGGGGGANSGRMHISAPEKIYLLPKGGLELTSDWGAEPTLNIRSGAGKTGRVCIDDQCITKADLIRFKA